MGGGGDTSILDSGAPHATVKFTQSVREWAHVGGATRGDGTSVTEPPELREARTVDAVCQRYSCLPSELAEEDPYVYRMLTLIAIADGKDAPAATPIDDALAGLPMEIV